MFGRGRYRGYSSNRQPRCRTKSPPAVRVIPDFRAPDNIRLGIAPIYTRFTEIYRAMDRMRAIVDEKIYME